MCTADRYICVCVYYIIFLIAWIYTAVIDDSFYYCLLPRVTKYVVNAYLVRLVKVVIV